MLLKLSITQRLRTDYGRSMCVVNRLTGITHPHSPHHFFNKKDTHLNIVHVNNPPFGNQGSTATQAEMSWKSNAQTAEQIKINKKYQESYSRVSYYPPIWKQAQSKGVKKSRLTIRGNEDQDIAASGNICARSVIYIPNNLVTQSVIQQEKQYKNVKRPNRRQIVLSIIQSTSKVLNYFRWITVEDRVISKIEVPRDVRNSKSP